MPKNPASTHIGDAAQALECIAPTRLAQAWDNVGLLVGDRAAPCRRMLLCIDLTPPVLGEAIRRACDLIVAYHPPLFQAVKRILAQSAGTDALIHRAIAARIAIYSPHTALDAAPGGTNDVLGALCGLTDAGPFEFVDDRAQQAKVVTFLPADRVEELAAALSAAGAGVIGDYQQCSFRLEGRGTFFGADTTHPAVGQKGKLEQVAETRIEMICPITRLPEVVAALRAHHPYEEPAFDIYPLIPEPVAGLGRVGRLPAKTTLEKLARQLIRATGSRTTTIIGRPRTPLRTAAICVGAAGRLPLEKPRSADCDVVITGEIRHHDALTLLRENKCAIALGHWESERPVLSHLARRLNSMLTNVRVLISRQDVPPFEPVPRA